VVPPSATAPAPAVPPATGSDLIRLKGVGPRLVAQLEALGVTSVAQIARWDDAEIDRIDAQLGRFTGRIRRDDWVGQALLLENGDMTTYEARFGKM
jgi:predicted flap endonuclease-1-like 5' DNA nuclease